MATNTIDCSQMIIKSGYFTLHTHITHCYAVREDFRTTVGTVLRYSRTFHTAHANEVQTISQTYRAKFKCIVVQIYCTGHVISSG
jgi:uncharacterized protein YaiE (UPF0345 family)